MIPPELYEVVAEILVFVDGMDKIKEKIKAHQNKSCEKSIHGRFFT